MESKGFDRVVVAEQLADARRQIDRLVKQNRRMRLVAVSALLVGLAGMSGSVARSQPEDKGKKKDVPSDFRFTHRVKQDTPYYRSIVQGQSANGTLLKGSQVMTKDAGANPVVIWLRAEVNGGSLESLTGKR